MAGGIAGGPLLAVAGNRAINQTRVERRKVGVIHLQARGDAGAKTFHDQIGPPRQTFDQGPRRRVFQIEREDLLVAVGHREHRAGHAPREVASQRLDLDDLGAEVGQGHGRERPRQQQ